mgnify:CR=1 FL=1
MTALERAPEGSPVGGFIVRGDWGEARAPRVILATGGKALPKSGSDGAGYEFAQALGHTVTDHVFPALVPLVLPGTHPLRVLSGLTLPATLVLRAASGKVLKEFTNSLLCTHFGLSGPCALDISRYWRAALIEDAGAGLFANFIAGEREDTLSRNQVSDLGPGRDYAPCDLATGHKRQRQFDLVGARDEERVDVAEPDRLGRDDDLRCARYRSGNLIEPQVAGRSVFMTSPGTHRSDLSVG